MIVLEKANIKYYEDLKKITNNKNIMQFIGKGNTWDDEYLKNHLKTSQNYWDSDEFNKKKNLFVWIIVINNKAIGYLRWEKDLNSNRFMMNLFLDEKYQNQRIDIEAGKKSIQKLCKYYKERYIYSETTFDNIVLEKTLILIGFNFLEKNYNTKRNVFRFDTFFKIFPLLKLFSKYTASDLLEIIKNYKPERIVNERKLLENHKTKKNLKDMNEYYFRTLNDEYVIFNFNYHKQGYLFDITDLFSEKCKYKCKYKFLRQSPYDFFKNNQYKIKNILKKERLIISRENIRDKIYKLNMPCTNFKILFAMSILHYFKPKSWLDLSAGWGDRLISAIAYDIDLYVGIDPSSCMNEIYYKIINDLAPTKKDNFKIIQKGSQEVKLDTKFDFVFTSPPFFDYEDYIDEETQSMHKFNSYDKWMKEFMLVTVENAWHSLKDGKYMALYIPYKYEGKDCFEEINRFIINKLQGNFSGALYFYWEDTYKIRNLYVWKK